MVASARPFWQGQGRWWVAPATKELQRLVPPFLVPIVGNVDFGFYEVIVRATGWVHSVVVDFLVYGVRRCAFKGRRECAVFSETGAYPPPLDLKPRIPVSPYSRSKDKST